MSKKKRRIKARRTWTRSPIEKVIPNKRVKDEPYNGMTEEDYDIIDDITD